MKTVPYLLAGAFVALAVLPISASAEEAAVPSGARAPAEATTPVPPAPEKAMKPHSHMEQKGGVAPQAAPQGGAKKPHASGDKSRHFHPRDMK